MFQDIADDNNLNEVMLDNDDFPIEDEEMLDSDDSNSTSENLIRDEDPNGFDDEDEDDNPLFDSFEDQDLL